MTCFFEKARNSDKGSSAGGCCPRAAIASSSGSKRTSLGFGQITFTVLRDLTAREQLAAGETLVRKDSFHEHFQRRTASLPQTTNFPLSFFQKSCMTPPILPHREGRTRGRHDMRGGDAVAVSGRSVTSVMPTNDVDADVKSCGPGLPVLRPSGRCPLRGAQATGARTPVPEEITYKR